MARKDEIKLSPQAKVGALALSEIQMATRFHRLYPHDHPFCTKAIGTSMDRLASYGERFGSLEVEILRDGLYLDDELILRDSDQSTDLTTLLYPEGVRDLTFDVGVSAEELLDFVVILSTHYTETAGEVTFGNDLLTALWRRDLGTITYRIHDPLAPSFVQSPQANKALAPLAQRIRGLLHTYGYVEQSDVGSGTELKRAVDGLDVEKFAADLDAKVQREAVDDISIWATRPDQVEAFLRTREGTARRQLREQLDSPLQADTLGRTADIVAWAAGQGDLAPQGADVASFMAGSTLHALSRGDLTKAGAMLAHVKALDGGRGTVRASVSSQLGTPEGLGFVAKALEQRAQSADADSLIEEGLEFLMCLEDSAVPGVVGLYESLENAAVRRVFRRFLSSRVSAMPEEIAKLTRSEDPEIAKEAMGMLALAGPRSRAFELLQSAASGLEGAQGELAQEALDAVSGERGRKHLIKRLLEDPDKKNRLAAAHKLESTGVAKSYDPIAEYVESSAFLQREPDEMHVVFELLTHLGGVRAFSLLQRIAGIKLPLLVGRRETQQLKALAAAILRSKSK